MKYICIKDIKAYNGIVVFKKDKIHETYFIPSLEKPEEMIEMVPCDHLGINYPIKGFENIFIPLKDYRNRRLKELGI